jgi:flagellar hook-associated protein 2
MDLGVAGLASQFDWASFVEQVAQIQRAPQTSLRNEQSTIDQRSIAYGSLVTQLQVLQNRVDTLNDSSFFDSRLAQTGDSTVATASANAGAVVGSSTFHFTQLATAAVQQGGSDAGGKLSATDEVSSLVLGNAGFSTSVTAGTFTVNGKTITIATTDTLQEVFDKISTATSGAVTGGYSSATDKITLTGSGEIILGSAADTSNFLQVARLYNNGSGSVTSATALGSVKLSSALDQANFATTLSDGGSGAGAFTINGVSIAFSASTDSLANVIKRINDSGAGVTASYDSANDRLILTNKTTGDKGIALADVTGNFLAATKLSTGTLQHGKNLTYTVNGGDPLTSLSNTITEDSSGITGLTVTALTEGASTTVSVSTDAAKIKSALESFITEYNKAQQMIDTNTASTTDSKGKVTAGILASEREASDASSQLRSLLYTKVSGLSGTIDQLATLGYDTNGKDNTIALGDSAKLDNALANNLSDVKALFTTATTGIAARLSDYIDRTAGDEGSLVNHQDVLNKQSAGINTQVDDLERIVQANRQQLIDSFIAMEVARAKINQQMQFLNQRFGTTSSGT